MSPDAFSRRGWLLRLGGAVLLQGINSNDPAAAESKALPPGLYEPSLQHLAHTLKVNTAAAPESHSPSHFSLEEFSLVKILVGRILGKEPSDPTAVEIAVWIDSIVGQSEQVRNAARSLSPAHRRLAVDYYGEDIVRQLEQERPEVICRDGLAGLKQASFETLDSSTQLARLVELENANSPFIAWIKRCALDGFYTSREGLEELDYKGNAMYAQSPGCDHEGHS